MTQSFVKYHNGTPLEFEIAQTGKYRGRRANTGWVFARRSQGWTSTSLMGDVANYLDTSQAEINIPNTATAYYLRSSSASDTVGGTGIRSVRMNYLTADGTRTITTVNMNGTTAVSLGNGISAVQYIESADVGSNGVAVGTITISSVTGAPTTAQIIEQIDIGAGRSMSGRVVVPKDFTLYLKGWGASAIGNTMDVRLRAQAFTDDRSLSPGFHFQDVILLAQSQNFDSTSDYLAVPAGAMVKLSAIPGGAPAGNRCDGHFQFLLIQN